uniref:YaiI/YqxD family protein n=1 Tax=Faecalibacterium prausnitzii TaxID=853 RepID=UPI003FF10A02
MNILIDADGCPVVDLTLQIAKRFGISVIILCDTSHQIEREGAQTLVFDKGSDSVDFALVNRVKPGDVVVTQDYGLASMCLAKCARVLNQNGLEYTADNIDALMLRRYENKKLLRAGMNCTPFVRQYGILFRKWGVFVCQRDNESTTERRR